jgi:DNA-binding response OmpR family regulator
VLVFGWASEAQEPPPQWDLRRAGWAIGASAAVVLVDRRGPPRPVPGDPARCLLLGVESGGERARLLAEGVGDALPGAITLPELDQRARRFAAATAFLPRLRDVGPLTLDLLRRDARRGQRWLALHPREFELLWRLAERPGERVSRARLLREVWRLDFEPGSNSVEVHVSRLRAKLAAAGIEGLVETDPHGGYRLAEPRRAPVDLQLCR